MLLRVLRHPAARGAVARRPGNIDAAILLLPVLLCAVSLPCPGQTQRLLCHEGFGSFSSQFFTGVTVSVAPSTNAGFAAHTCDATLRWGKHMLPVAQEAWQINLDVMGADLGAPCARSGL